MVSNWSRLALGCGCVAALLFLTPFECSAQLTDKPLLQQLPGGALGFVEVNGLGDVVERVKNSQRLAELKQTAQYKQLLKRREVAQGMVGLAVAESFLGRDLWTATRELLGGQVAVAAYPKSDGEGVTPLVVVRVASQDAFAEIREKSEPFLRPGLDLGKLKPALQGVQTFSANERAQLAFGPDWIAATNSQPMLRKFLKHLADDDRSEHAASSDGLKLMRAQMGTDHLVSAAVDLDAIRAAQGQLYPDQMDNGLASLLFSGIMKLAMTSPYLGMTVDAGESGLNLKWGIAGNSAELPETYSAFFSAADSGGSPPLPAVPNLLGGFAIHRDFATWYRSRDDLMKPEVLPAFDKFETGLANILPGRDFGEDVLPLLGKNLQFVAAPQTFDHLDGRPGIELPGFAVIVELAKPEGADLVNLFFQTLSAILNIEAGKQGRQPLVMASESYHDVQINFGRYLKKPTGKRLSLVHNFRPASARIGDYFVISSSLSLCREIVDALNKPAAPHQVNRNFNFELYPRELAKLADANRRFFTAQAVKGGRSMDQAKSDFSLGMQVLKMFRMVRFNTHVHPESFEVELEVQVQ